MPTNKALLTGLALAFVASLPAGFAVNEIVSGVGERAWVSEVEAPEILALGPALEVRRERPVLIRPAPGPLDAVAGPTVTADRDMVALAEERLVVSPLLQPAPSAITGVTPPERVASLIPVEEGIRTPSLARVGSV